jgi:hypothetical protein
LKEYSKILILLLLLVAFAACEEQSSNPPFENQAPDTFIFLFPDSGATLNQQKSRLTVHWWGDDPDGLVAGYYYRWLGLSPGWEFTPANDSLFSLPIGTVDTLFTIEVAAADDQGNGVYDNEVIRDGINYGPEPFYDLDSNGVFSEGDILIDIGLIDPTPARQEFPIRNSAPEIEWNELSFLPPESFPVITLGWNATDLDGDETIVNINLALNDTNASVQLPGTVRLVTLRIKDVNAQNPEMEILINGSDSDIYDSLLTNLKLDDFNRLYIQAEDISGSASPFVSLPDTGSTWYVRKPSGDLLLVDDYTGGGNVNQFYSSTFDQLLSGGLAGNYDILDIENAPLPYENITFLETLKLFDFLYWFSDDSPRLDLTNLITQEYLTEGGKIAYSLTLRDSSSSFSFDLATIQNFLPIENFGEPEPLTFLLPGADILRSDQTSTYPNMRTATTVGFVRTYIPSQISAVEVYDLSASQLSGNVSLIDVTKSLFFIGLPLHQCDAVAGSVRELLEKVFVEEFGLGL